ncbi:polysaccharide biosynthesis/export family protein [Candidatus Pelagibacter communis]|uniref:polysaccharide biosynthesis/export family protein n=1 Tax=Pelagibacter ubique TaxID=198252 RepID=UPI00094CC57B|nr:polysaccharide biosynthesis/export family protein [Candidatus Pelagibacter ubique]
MICFKKNLIIISILFFLSSCVSLPGINKNPSKKKINKKLNVSEYSIKDVGINLININSLSEIDIDYYNKEKIEEIDYKINKFSKIYDYKYEYILGPADSISIDLTDTDDLDNVYLIDQEGMIDLPFIGKIKLDGLSLDEAQNILTDVIKDFYKNPDLQIKIEEFNSSKIYIVGAVRNQKTINLNQKPIKLIEAAIEANFNPSAADKLYGTKGFLRRDDQVYKINLANAFSGTDEKENFYLKKNDVIFIDRNSDAIHVFGEVSKPGVYFPNLDYSLTELISTSGLNQLTSNAKKVYVIREKFKTFLEVDVFQLDIRNPVNLIAGRKFKLQAKDIVFVPPTEIVKWNRTISLLLPQTDLFSSYNPIIQEGVKADSANLSE